MGKNQDNAQRRCPFSRSLTLRYLTALSLIAVLTLVSQSLIRHILLTVDRTAAIIDVSSSQRALTQRLLAQCLLLAAADTGDEEARRDIRAELEHALDKLEKNHRHLLADLNDPDSPAAHSPTLATIYFQPPHELDRRMRFFIASTRRFLESGGNRPALSDPLFLDVLVFGERELLRDLNAVIQEYQRETRNRMVALGRLETIAAAALLALLVLVGLLLFRPMVARICADRKRLEKANDDLARLAATDQLTGAFNRLKFHEAMAHEVQRARRYGLPLSIVMFDIDHFKQVNDTKGHAAGDDLLRELARLIAANIRDADALFRYGGEEFLVLAPHTDRNQAALLAEKLRTLVAGHAFPRDIRATISLGAASLQAGETVEQLLSRVDAALYKAKENGRDRVEVAEDASGGQGSALDPARG